MEPTASVMKQQDMSIGNPAPWWAWAHYVSDSDTSDGSTSSSPHPSENRKGPRRQVISLSGLQKTNTPKQEATGTGPKQI
ncbi:hypothetical protein CDD81_3459 [Ophiocordyceps australis]|uniref:Uncharacterized protein n=1 Tax=Ophiocordyceps australis TaxID=1399860 RepID=A0A2C5YDW1_9HYPO|nr:hypothetical protein CDD81_3459 [Ophiocordyceps australis]